MSCCTAGRWPILIIWSVKFARTLTSWKAISWLKRPRSKKGTDEEKIDFMDYCFRKSLEATENMDCPLASERQLSFQDPAYRLMWKKLNAEAGIDWNA